VLSFETHNHDHKAEIDRIESNPLPPKKKQKSQKKLSEKLKKKKAMKEKSKWTYINPSTSYLWI